MSHPLLKVLDDLVEQSSNGKVSGPTLVDGFNRFSNAIKDDFPPEAANQFGSVMTSMNEEQLIMCFLMFSHVHDTSCNMLQKIVLMMVVRGIEGEIKKFHE